jgi:hypothetical protein
MPRTKLPKTAPPRPVSPAVKPARMPLATQVGIGAAIGLVFFVTSAFQSEAPLPTGMSLVLQLIGAMLGGMVLFAIGRLAWYLIGKF